MDEESGSNEHIHEPKVFFIFHNLPPPILHADHYWTIPPMDENPVEHLDATYRHVVDAIFRSLLNFLGRLGGLYINLRQGEGYLHIRSPRVFWDLDSFPEMLSEVLRENRVPQDYDAIAKHTTNLRSLFDSFPNDSRVIGCLLDDQVGDREEINLREYLKFLVHPSKDLVFVIGNFRHYVPLEEHIDEYVKVSEPGMLTNRLAEFICQECQRKWNVN